MSGAFCTNCEDWSSTPLIPLPCRCHWCTPCLITAFSLSRSEEHYPPKCCSTLNFTTFKSYLPNSLIADLETKIPIFETPGKLRVFCAHKTCLMFIPPADVQGEVAWCQSCGAKTCVLCKWHIKVSVALTKLCRKRYNSARVKITNSARIAVRWWREVVVRERVRDVLICCVLVDTSFVLTVVRVSGIGVVVWVSK